MVRKCKGLLVIVGVLLPAMASALGLGELRLTSFLNEPLRAEVDLLDVQDLDEGQLRIRLASSTDFDRAGVERAYFLTSMKFDVSIREDGTGRLFITSSEAVLEPYLDFLVEARWPSGRILREYTLLLDLPALVGPDSGMTAAASAPAPTPIETEQKASQVAEEEAELERYGTGTDSDPGPGTDYLVKQQETLWGIASRGRPQGTSVQQAMLDIKRLNPEAFIGGNINQLKAGYLLRLPTRAEISEIDPQQLVAEIEQQEQRWRDNQAAIDARGLDATAADGAGRGQTDEEQGRLQIAGVEESEYGGSAVDAAGLEQLDEAQRDNAELQTRIDAMEAQMLTLQRLLTLKDDQIAALQSALGGEELETPVAIDEMEGTISEVPDLVGDSGIIEEIAEEIELAEEPSQDYPAPAPAPADEGIVGMLMDYVLYGVGVLAIVLLLLGWRFKDKLNLASISAKLPLIGRKGAQQAAGGDADDEFAGVELGDDGLIIDEFSEQTPTIEDSQVTERLTFSDTDEDAYAAQFETGDALAEADIYIAYGRFPQAVNLLKAAIEVEPVNLEYRVKLMEACVEMVDREEFQQQYADIQFIGDETALKRGREIAEAADGGEVWLEDLPEPSITAEDIAAAEAAQQEEAAAEEAPAAADDAPALAGEEVTELDVDLDGGLELAEDLDLDADLDVDLELELEEAELELGDDDDATDLAEDAEKTETVEDEAAAGEEEEPLIEAESTKPEAAAATDDDLDHFDMGAFPATDSVAEENEPDTEAAEEIELPDLEADEISQDLKQDEELLLDDSPIDDTEPPEELSGEIEDDLVTDFGDLEIEEGAELVADEELEVEVEVEVELDDDEEVNLEQSLDELTDSFGAAYDAADGSGDSEDMVFAADGDEISTKLDLARAYMDMGDEEGAKSILEEVLQDGNDSQKQEAQSLIDNID